MARRGMAVSQVLLRKPDLIRPANGTKTDTHRLQPHIPKPLCVKLGCLDALNGAGDAGRGCRFGSGPGWLC